MLSRRVFLKNSGFALLSLGFAPAFLTRTAYAQGRSRRANRYRQPRKTDRAERFRAASLTTHLPRRLQGSSPAVAMSQIAQFDIRAGQTSAGATFESLYAEARDRVLGGAGRDAFDAMKMLKAADPARYQPEHGAEYPRSPFGQALKQIAQLV